MIYGFEVIEALLAGGLEANGFEHLLFEAFDFVGDEGLFPFETIDILVDLVHMRAGFDFFGVGFVDGGAHFLEVVFEVAGLAGELFVLVLQILDTFIRFGKGDIELSEFAFTGN